MLHAIGHYVYQNFTNLTVCYVSTETFLNEFIDSIRTVDKLPSSVGTVLTTSCWWTISSCWKAKRRLRRSFLHLQLFLRD